VCCAKGDVDVPVGAESVAALDRRWFFFERFFGFPR
jgi:hypothetical protein